MDSQEASGMCDWRKHPRRSQSKNSKASRSSWPKLPSVCLCELSPCWLTTRIDDALTWMLQHTPFTNSSPYTQTHSHTRHPRPSAFPPPSYCVIYASVRMSVVIGYILCLVSQVVCYECLDFLFDSQVCQLPDSITSQVWNKSNNWSVFSPRQPTSAQPSWRCWTFVCFPRETPLPPEPHILLVALFVCFAGAGPLGAAWEKAHRKKSF